MLTQMDTGRGIYSGYLLICSDTLGLGTLGLGTLGLGT